MRWTPGLRFSFPLIAVLAGVSCAPAEGETLAGGKVTSVVHDPAAVNAFIVELADGSVALIDSGLDPEAKPLREALGALGSSPDDVAAVLFTHGHADHVTGALAFPAARRFALEAEAEVVAGREIPTRPLPRFSEAEETGIEVSEVVNDGDIIELGSTRFEVFALPGHTPGSAAFLVHGVLFLGDAAARTRDDTIEGAPWLFSTNVEESDDALASLAERLAPRGEDIRALAFGHSPALEHGLAPLLDFAARQAER